MEKRMDAAFAALNSLDVTGAVFTNAVCPSSLRDDSGSTGDAEDTMVTVPVASSLTGLEGRSHY